MSKTKKRLAKYVSLSLPGGWEGHIILKQDDPEWKFQTYRGTNLCYEMLCEPTSSDNEEKEEDKLNSYLPINLKLLTTNLEKILVSLQFTEDKALQIKLEE